MSIFNEVIDITHHSNRTQEGNLRAAGIITDEVTTVAPNRTNIPQSITLETAIEFFNNNAHGEYATLYKQTAKWLTEYLAVPKSELRKMKEASAEGEK